MLSSSLQRFPVPKRTGFFFFSSLKFGSPSRLTRQKVPGLVRTNADRFQDVSSRRESPRRTASCACRAAHPLPPLVRIPSIATSLCAAPSPRIVRR